MKKLLITGFEPFGGETINSSWEAVSRLGESVGEYSLNKLCLPVVFGEAAKTVIDLADELQPDAILCIGQAGGRKSITPEMVGINLRHGLVPDNRGYSPKDEIIISDGNDAYFSTIPVRKIAEGLKIKDIPAEVSYSAGAYVCNDVLYTLLARFRGTETKVGFIHIPYCSEHGKSPSMPLDKITEALCIAIEHLDD